MGKAERIEIALDGMAAAWLGLASALFVWAASMQPGPVQALAPIAAAVLVGAVAYRGMAALRGPQFAMPRFELLPIETDEPEELLLTSEMVWAARAPLTVGEDVEGELLPEDALVRPDPDARVVQLFDASRMPTAGELRLRIDRHLRSGGRPVAREPQPDASQALFDALADLRRSLG